MAIIKKQWTSKRRCQVAKWRKGIAGRRSIWWSTGRSKWKERTRRIGQPWASNWTTTSGPTTLYNRPRPVDTNSNNNNINRDNNNNNNNNNNKLIRKKTKIFFFLSHIDNTWPLKKRFFLMRVFLSIQYF